MSAFQLIITQDFHLFQLPTAAYHHQHHDPRPEFASYDGGVYNYTHTYTYLKNNV